MLVHKQTECPSWLPRQPLRKSGCSCLLSIRSADRLLSSANILTIYGHEGIVGPICHRVLQLEKLLQILVVGVLLEISGNGKFVAIGG